MGAPGLDIDKEAVKAHAVTYGVREAARAFNLPESTVKSWSTRYGWLTEAHEAVRTLRPDAQMVAASIPNSMRPIASNASKPSVAARNSEANLSKRAKLYGQRYVAKTLRHASTLAGETALAAAQSVKAVAGTGQIVFKDWQPDAATQGPLVSFTLHAGVAAPELHVESPIVDMPAIAQEGA